MTTTEIKAKWRARLEKLEARYYIDKGMQVQVDPAEFAAVAEDGLPPKLHRVLRGMKEHEVTCVLLTPKQLKMLLDYEPYRRKASNKSADVSRLAEPRVDNQVDARPDRQGADTEQD